MLAWAVTFAYLAAAWFCWVAAGVPRTPQAQRRLWRFAALLLLIAGVNKQLDLQTLAIGLARDVLTGTAWFANRRAIEARLMQLVIVGAALAGAWLLWRVRRFDRPLQLACLGLAIVTAYWLTRLAYFSHLAGSVLGGPRLELLELGGVIVTGGAGFWKARGG